MEGALELTDLASRTTFVRMISNKDYPAIIQGGEQDPVYQSNKFGFQLKNEQSPYLKMKGEGIKPISGIKDISVEYKGGYKAIRQATINWSVNSIKDLDRLTPHFLTIGKTMLLEWGWIMKGKMISSFYDEWNEEILDEAFSNPMPRIIENEGNYDAMAGVISNFGYDLNESGGFDCVTTMVSMGTNLFEGQKADSDGADVKIIPKEDGTNSEPKINNDGLINAIINLDRIIFHQYFEVPFDKNYFQKTLAYNNWKDFGRNADAGGPLLQHYGKTPEPDEKIFGFSTKKGSGTVLSEADMWESADNMSDEELEGREWYDKNDKTAPQIVLDLRYSGADSWVKKEGVQTGVQDGITADVIFTASSFFNGKYITSTDLFVTWGWFEDNILSRYIGYSKGLGQEILNGFRSVEFKIDKFDKPTNKKVPVLIRNNKEYLFPKNPMRFFLPGQNIKYEAIDFGVNKEENESTEGTGTIGPFLKLFLSVNANKPFAQGDGTYGSLRNIMVNTKEIKKAFGIDADKEAERSSIFYSDTVKPLSTVRACMKRLLSQLNDNFFNFWKFEIVTDTFGGHMKIIDKNSSPHLSKANGKLYSVFVGDKPDATGNTQPASHKVHTSGIYKFPAFTAGSIVKTQNLSFKIPDSMAVTAMYGSNKNKGSGIVIDTSNENAIIETIFSNDVGDVYEDNKLKGLERAYLLTDVGHNIGSLSANEQVRFDGSFLIDSESASSWWCSWTTSPVETEENVTIINASVKTKKDRPLFKVQASMVLQGTANIDITAARSINEGIDKQITEILMKNPKIGTEQNMMASVGSGKYSTEAIRIADAEIKELTAGKQDTRLMGKYYTFKFAEGGASGYDLSLFAAGEAVIKSLLFGYDKDSSVYQSNFIIPAELSLTVDGIGGIIPGDIIQTDYIQQKYNKTIKDEDGNEKGPFTFFQIFGMNQKVSSDGWETELITKMRVNNDVLALSAGEIMTSIRGGDTEDLPDTAGGHIPGQAEEARIAEGTTTYPVGNFEPNYGLSSRKGISTMGKSQNTYDILRMDNKFDLEYTPYDFHASSVSATRRERELGIEHAGDAPITPLEAASLDGEPQPQFTPFIPFDKNAAVANMFKIKVPTLGQPGVQFSSVQTRTPFMPDRIIEKLESEGSGDDSDVKIIQLGTGAATPVDPETEEWDFSGLDLEFDDFSNLEPAPSAKPLPNLNFDNIKKLDKKEVVDKETPKEVISVAETEKKKIWKFSGYLKQVPQAGDKKIRSGQGSIITYPARKNYGWWIDSNKGKEYVGVIIEYQYKSEDGLIVESKTFEGTTSKRSRPPYTKDIERAIFKAEGKGKHHFKKKYSIEVEVDE